MTRSLPARVLRRLTPAAVLLLCVIPATAAGQGAGGTITGRVTDTNGRAVAGAEVRSSNLAVVATTDEAGRFLIPRQPAGPLALRVFARGYREGAVHATVREGEHVEATIILWQAVGGASPLVVTGLGPERREGLHMASGHVDAAPLVDAQRVTSLGDLLTARVPGVQVLPGTTPGADVRLRIRGTASIHAPNDPVLIVDGVRVTHDPGYLFLSDGSVLPHRLNDINPEDIESVEVFRGPATAALQDAHAATGVVVIRTRRGTAGAPRWSYFTEQSLASDRNARSAGWFAHGTNLTTGASSTVGSPVGCLLRDAERARCRQDSLAQFNVHESPVTTAVAAAHRWQHGLGVSGGTGPLRYRVHGEWEREDDVTRLPERGEQAIVRDGMVVRPEWRDPSGLHRSSFQGNVDLSLPFDGTLALSAGHADTERRASLNADEATITTGALIGARLDGGARIDDYFRWLARAFRHKDVRDATRTLASAALDVPLRTWLSLHAGYGIDRSAGDRAREEAFDPNQYTSYAADYARDARATTTVRLAADRELLPGWRARTMLAVQRGDVNFTVDGESGSISHAGDSSAYRWYEFRRQYHHTAYIVDQALTLRERLFLAAGVRSERFVAGERPDVRQDHPRLAAAFLLRAPGHGAGALGIGDARVRVAYGSSSTRTTERGNASPSFAFSAGTGDPETVTELEAGIDGTVANGRLRAEVTWYTRTTKDMLVEVPSTGGGYGYGFPSFGNVASVRNRGIEAALDALLLRGGPVEVRARLTGSTNANIILALGNGLFFSDMVAQREGYPVNGYWGYPIAGYGDANGDGLLGPAEVRIQYPEAYLGSSMPTREAGLGADVALFDGRLRFAALADYRGGHSLYNRQESFRCRLVDCRAAYDRTAPLWEQARLVAAQQHGTMAGYIEPADFVRLRELSVTASAPERWLGGRVPAGMLTASLAARNLAVLWTKYGGVDPEANHSAADVQDAFYAAPLPTVVSLRIGVRF